MGTYELIEQLAQKPKEEIKYALLALMRKGQIDFLDLNQAYVAMLEEIRRDQDNKLWEADQCVYDSFLYSKNPKNANNEGHIQRCLYLLNQLNHHNMQRLNDKYDYDESAGKAESWYERNKKEKIL